MKKTRRQGFKDFQPEAIKAYTEQAAQTIGGVYIQILGNNYEAIKRLNAEQHNYRIDKTALLKDFLAARTQVLREVELQYPKQVKKLKALSHAS
jgi:hypothetical protein